MSGATCRLLGHQVATMESAGEPPQGEFFVKDIRLSLGSQDGRTPSKDRSYSVAIGVAWETEDLWPGGIWVNPQSNAFGC
jgi:hypothetical protein